MELMTKQILNFELYSRQVLLKFDSKVKIDLSSHFSVLTGTRCFQKSNFESLGKVLKFKIDDLIGISKFYIPENPYIG